MLFAKKIPPTCYIFCLWVWILTFLYYFDFQNISMLYLSCVGVIFTIHNSFFYAQNTRNIQQKLSIVLLEMGIFAINIYKHFFIDNRPLIVYTDIYFSIMLCLIYLVFLRYNNSSFYKLYFVDLMNYYK